MQSGSGRPFRDAQCLGNGDEGQANVVVQDEDRPLVDREPAKCLLELVAVGDALDVVVLARRVRREDPNGGMPTAYGAVRLRSKHEPGFGMPILRKALRVAEVGQFPPDREQGFLQRVLGENWVPEDPSGDAQQGVTDLEHHVRECVLIAGAGSLHHTSVQPTLHAVAVSTTVYP